ncbi:inositol monophosphatase family protein [Streptococcaceae bacterium ESL0729]|nr:inositol monophosphatase family protein [Streptococcaceae bacterium ESL0729]
MENLSAVQNKFNLAREWILEAGTFVKESLNKELEIDEKSCQTDLVTNMDRAVQARLVKHIRKNFPKDNILAEEDDLKAPIDQGNVWVIDPIDGTANFVAQGDDFAVLLAYFEEGQGQFGLILDVMNDNLYWGDGKSVYKNAHKLEKPRLDLKHSLIGVNSIMYRTNDHGLYDYSRKTLGIRVFGSAGIDYVKLIEGKISGYFSNLSPWDYAAGTIILSAFGYVTEKMDGGLPSYEGREKVFTVAKEHLPLVREFIK